MPILPARIPTIAAIVAVVSMAGSSPLGARSYQGFDFQPTAVSDDGSTVVGDSVSDDPSAVRWRSGVGPLTLWPGRATGVSADGNVVVGWGHLKVAPDTFTAGAVRWTERDGRVFLGWGFSQDMTPDGSVVVGRGGSESTIGPFRWTAPTGMVSLPVTIGTGSANAVSDDGSIVAGWGWKELLPMATQWTPAGGEQRLNAWYSNASAMTGDGSIVVGSADVGGEVQAIRWTRGEQEGLGYLSPGHRTSDAASVSDTGVIVGNSGFYEENEFVTDAFIWDEQHGMRDLRTVLINDYGIEFTGWSRLSEAIDITPDGRVIIGTGINPEGVTQGWIAVVPEPGGVVMYIAAAAFITARAERRRGELSPTNNPSRAKPGIGCRSFR